MKEVDNAANFFLIDMTSSETSIMETTLPPSTLNTMSTPEGSVSLSVCKNHNMSLDSVANYELTSLWVEGICQIIFGVFGLICNLFSIYILSCNRLRSVFNRLLACLLMLHTVYICSTIVKFFSRKQYNQSLFFAYILYPLCPMALHASTFITVLMARERFLAIRHPVEYRNATIGANPWLPAFKHLGAAILCCGIFVSPMLLETKIDIHNQIDLVQYNLSHIQYVSMI